METDEPGPGDGPAPGDESESAGGPQASDQPFATGHFEHVRINPADPALSAEPGSERRSFVIPVAIAAGVVLAVALWLIARPHGIQPAFRTFQNPDIGVRFDYPSELRAGPNFLRAESGSILTIERHSLDMAKKDWVAQLPDVLFSQVKIQIDENYIDAAEQSRRSFTLGGRPALEVVLKGRSAAIRRDFIISIVIAATKDWVYVIRSYSPVDLDARERPLFTKIRDTWTFL